VPTPAPAIVDQVQVIEEHKGVETRKQVAANGRTIETVPVQPAPQPQPPATSQRPTTTANRQRVTGNYVVQVGAFADANNAALLQQKLKSEGFDTFIDKGPVLSKVQIGPFETRDEAVKTRARLEAAGVSAIIIAQR
jgi:DedD protein